MRSLSLGIAGFLLAQHLALASITIEGFADADCTTHVGTLTIGVNGGCQKANATWHGITISGEGGPNCRLFPFAGANCFFVEQSFGPITGGQPAGCLVPTLLGNSADGAQAFDLSGCTFT
ncbi:hypothetical protein AURDEDRAFT_174159 [Auricularia subglabra TFB-10046 SS5]|nr:hypothetical protein AURDEDRAFT_174159 [Auricularia subglabra TFB-10046 SS5]